MKKAIFFLLFTTEVFAGQFKIGFLSPTYIASEVISKTNIGLFNAQTPDQVDENYRKVKGTTLLLSVDLGPVLAEVATPKSLNSNYTTPDGKVHKKKLPALTSNKVRKLPSASLIIARITPFLDRLVRHKKNVGTIFLADEPYLNGITQRELERTAKIVRKQLDIRGLNNAKIGVIFANGMFDREFAKMIDARAGEFVRKIDQYIEQESTRNNIEFTNWLKTIRVNRLSTYDSAGNMYTEGGLPRGFDVYGFDFYLSTILLDEIHNGTLAWLAKKYPQFGCGKFLNKPMQSIRKTLSFFQDGFVAQGDAPRNSDRVILDDIYRCRIGAVTHMLQKAASSTPASLLMLSESSNNGVLEFTSKGEVKKNGQPKLLIESRVFDEVKRGVDFYKENHKTYNAGLMFFPYLNEFDASINLDIGGVSSMPSVKDLIYKSKNPR